MLRLIHVFALAVASLPFAQNANAEFVSPDIVILGDSQIPFGSGPAFLKFFADIKTHCPPNEDQIESLKTLGEMDVAVIGVRSTSLHSWTARMGRAKGAICDVDPKWKANAGVFGSINTSGNKYAQIGRGEQYQFCEKGKSAFEAMFRPDYYTPKLLLLSFLGNSARKWAQSKEAALADVVEMSKQLPAGMPCIFMTTAPPYSKKLGDRRLKAQANLKWAFEESGASCSFVEGATPETVAANQGNKNFFRRNKSGRVKDPFHPNEKAAEKFFSIEMDDICSAIYEQISLNPKDPS